MERPRFEVTIPGCSYPLLRFVNILSSPLYDAVLRWLVPDHVMDME